jgi:hypothetical protein
MPVFRVAVRYGRFAFRGHLAVASIAVFFLAACSSGKSNSAPVVDSAPASSPATAPQKPAAGVRLAKTEKGWELLRNGSPYFIKGAGGDGSCELLAKLGGNSIRTWGTEGLQQQLDDAQRNGITVCAGIWLGHEGHGFSWNDAAQIARQTEMVKEAVQQFKSHPALLLWGLGNEMEGYEKGDNEVIWKAIDDLAALVKELDPDHPTMTVVAEIHGERVPGIHRWCPNIDIVGINSYGPAATVPERYRSAGGTKPYIVTEFGPVGWWEIARTEWGAPREPSSTEKTAEYRRAYEGAVLANPEMCLGSYAFLWGNKQEGTATWFGMLLPDGSRLAAADLMSEIWTGKLPPNRCPVLESLTIDGPAELEPGAVVQAHLESRDPEGDAIDVEWVLQSDSLAKGGGGAAEAVPPTFPDAILKADHKQAEVRMPDMPGAYRLFAYLRDRQGGAAVGNVPLLVNGETRPDNGS